MMASPSELSLECKPHSSYSMLLKSFGEAQIDQSQKLEEFLSRLEEERLKIDAFKRELPLCMQLLTNAMEASRQQLQSYKANQNGGRPVLEEFIPLKHSTSEGSEKADNINSDKSNWMTSAQLWSQTSDHHHHRQQQQHSTVTSQRDDHTVMSFSPKLRALDDNNKQRINGAFLPFSKDRNSISHSPAAALPELALASLEDSEDKKKSENENSASAMVDQSKGAANNTQQQAADSQTTTTLNNHSSNANQTHRKARRCWSPDLHRRFVNALQMLGGSQVATPKQIRELMKVDGLTNDEVKSHLQKYRLHTRRPSPSPQAAAAAAPQLVVLGGIWVPPEYATAAAAAHHGGAPPTLYGAHPAAHASPHYCATPVPQEFYPAPTPPQPAHHQLHHHPLHHQLHMYKPTSQTQSSPDSDVRGTGDRSESIEDGKSESSSWKAESGGENGGERKGLVLREEGEESNGSEITLKF